MKIAWLAPGLLWACTENSQGLDGSLAVDGGASDLGAGDLGSRDLGAFDLGGGDAGQDLGVALDGGFDRDAEPGDVPFALCRAGATGLQGNLQGQSFQYTTSSGRTGQGSARMGDTSLARWFGPGFGYFSSVTPLGEVAQAASAILALPATTSTAAVDFYCPGVATARFYDAAPGDARLEASLSALVPVGACPGGASTNDRLVLCVNNPGNPACTAPNGAPRTNWMSGTLGGEVLEESLGSIGLRAQGDDYYGLLRGGRLALYLEAGPAGHAGYLLMRGPGPLDPAQVYCVEGFVEGSPPLVNIDLTRVRRLGACGAAPGVGELELCSE